MYKQQLLSAYRSGKPINFSVASYNRELREDQKVGAGFLCLQKRAILASPIGSGKTLEVSAALCKLVELGRIKTFLIMSSLSTLSQWHEELNDYASLGVSIVEGTKQNRINGILSGTGRNIITVGSINADLEYHIKRGSYDCVVLDESTVIKNYDTCSWESVREVGFNSRFVFYVSASPFENNLLEIYSQAEGCCPGIIGTPQFFSSRYCVWERIRIRRGRKFIEIPKIVSYKNVEEFKAKVDPIILYRSDSDLDVKKIPIKCLTCKVDLTPEQRRIYNEVEKHSRLEDARSLGDVYKWQGQLLRAASSARFYGGNTSCKVDKVLEILSHPFLQERRFLVYTRNHVTSDHLVQEIKKLGKRVRKISGKESRAERDSVRESLLSGSIDVAIITDAAGKNIRLEGASVVIFVDRPWSGKAFAQIVGRSARQGQKELFVLVIVIIARNTKDDYVSRVMSGKENLADMFYGIETRLKGEKINSLDDLYVEGGKEKEVWK